jgi:transposase
MTNKAQAGINGLLEFAIRFNKWADEQKKPLSLDAIMNRWGVSYATAHRWRNAWLAANGLYQDPINPWIGRRRKFNPSKKEDEQCQS